MSDSPDKRPDSVVTPLRIHTDAGPGGLLIMIGLFGLLFSISWLAISWSNWIIALISLVTSLASFYLSSRLPQAWVEFGEQIKYCDFRKIHTHDWSDVDAICLLSCDDGLELLITFTDNKQIEFNEREAWESAEQSEGLSRTIIRTLVAGLGSEEQSTRECTAIALGKFGLLTCEDSYYTGREVRASWLVDMRKDLIGHLENVQRDTHDNVRKAAGHAIKQIYVATPELGPTTVSR